MIKHATLLVVLLSLTNLALAEEDVSITYETKTPDTILINGERINLDDIPYGYLDRLKVTSVETTQDGFILKCSGSGHDCGGTLGELMEIYSPK